MTLQIGHIGLADPYHWILVLTYSGYSTVVTQNTTQRLNMHNFYYWTYGGISKVSHNYCTLQGYSGVVYQRIIHRNPCFIIIRQRQRKCDLKICYNLKTKFKIQKEGCNI